MADSCRINSVSVVLSYQTDFSVKVFDFLCCGLGFIKNVVNDTESLLTNGLTVLKMVSYMVFLAEGLNR